MRLPAHYPAAIRSAAIEAFGPTAVVRLFGSRVDDAKRGGDIDLHVEADPAADLFKREIRFRRTLCDNIDEEQVDVVVRARDTEPRWIDNAAYRDGIIL